MYSVSILVCGLLCATASMTVRLSSRKQETILMVLFTFLFSLIMADRSLDIPDTFWYQNSFSELDAHQQYAFSLFQDNYRFGFEYGYIYFMQFFKRFISTDYRVFFFFCSIIISSLFIYSVKNIYIYLVDDDSEDINYPLLFCIYVSYFGLYYCGMAIRAGLAMGLILLGVVFSLRKKYVPAILLLFVAFTLQRTSVVGVGLLLSILFFRLKINKRIMMGIWLAIGILIFSGVATRLFSYTSDLLVMLFNRSSLDYSRYLLRGGQASEAGIAVFLDWVIGIIILLSIYEDERIARIFNIYLVGFIIIVFTMTIPGFNRISDYFTVVNIPMLYQFSTDRNINRFIRIFLCVLVVGLNIVRVLNRYGWV